MLAMMGLICHAEDHELYPGGNGKLLYDFNQESSNLIYDHSSDQGDKIRRNKVRPVRRPLQ